MKISKLFHWLYASVMLLPIFALGGTMLVYTFNGKAKDDKEITYKYESNDVYTSSDLKVGNIYGFTINQAPSSNMVLSYASAIYNVPYFNTESDSLVTKNGYLRIDIRTTDFIISNNDGYWLYSTSLSNVTFPLKFDMVLYEYRPQIGYGLECFSKTDFNVVDSINDVNYYDVFYNSLNKVQSMPIFSWSYDSFLVAPFSYIVALFGMPTTHVVVELLSYWLAISIIWLVFDLIMYVPLLVHRWIDKGVLE